MSAEGVRQVQVSAFSIPLNSGGDQSLRTSNSRHIASTVSMLAYVRAMRSIQTGTVRWKCVLVLSSLSLCLFLTDLLRLGCVCVCSISITEQ